MKLSDYVVDYLVGLGTRDVFMVIGGACAHLAHSLHDRQDIRYVCVQHEQAGAMAVEAYSRLTGRLGAMLVTSGPGATNLITGICGAWFDSIACLFLTGQVNTHEQRGPRPVRQVGFQETDIVSIVKPITKYATMIDHPERIRYELQKATYIARCGRPGPVLLDIPLDIQRADIDPNRLEGFDAPDSEDALSIQELQANVTQCVESLESAQRPVLLVGGGIRLANAQQEIRQVADRLGIPIVVSWSGFDLIAFNHPLSIGHLGVYGSRAANFTVQNSDLLLSVGSRLDTRQTGGKPSTFARQAKKIMVDIDPGELHKRRGLDADLAIAVDAKRFLQVLLESLPKKHQRAITSWVQRTQQWKRQYPTVLPEYFRQERNVNPYVFIKTLSAVLDAEAVVITDCGANLTWTIQAFEVKENQRVLSTFGNSPMGYSFAAAIGAAIGLNRTIICIIGDGGFQMNIQELQTVFHYKLPIKTFILNNHSYGIIKQFQDMYFNSVYVGSGEGYSCPDFVKVVEAYGIATARISSHSSLTEQIHQVLRQPGPVVCDVVLNDDAKLTPRLEFGKSIEDQTPYLSREEFMSNMIVAPVPESIEQEVKHV